MPRKIIGIYLEAHPGGRGMANCSWTEDGKVHGGHLSGDDPPFVHIDEGTVPKEIRDEIWKEAEALDDAVLALDMMPDPKWNGYNQLMITFETGDPMRYCWPFGEKDQDPRFKPLLDLLFKHRIGGW